MKRTFNASFLNSVANDPEVRPWLGHNVGTIDLTGIVVDPLNFTLETSDGGWVFHNQGGGSYQLHTMFLERGRGATHFEVGKLGLRYMFAVTNCTEITTQIPISNRAAMFCARRFGFRERFRRDRAFIQPDGLLCGVSYQAMTIDDWASREEEAVPKGEDFHNQIESAKVKFASTLPDHPKDSAHDHAVGITYMMIESGNHAKGVWYYNRWAALSGYAPCRVLTESPLLLDIGEGVWIEVRGGKFEVVRCP